MKNKEVKKELQEFYRESLLELLINLNSIINNQITGIAGIYQNVGSFINIENEEGRKKFEKLLKRYIKNFKNISKKIYKIKE